jgi:hypothetical protein
VCTVIRTESDESTAQWLSGSSDGRKCYIEAENHVLSNGTRMVSDKLRQILISLVFKFKIR